MKISSRVSTGMFYLSLIPTWQSLKTLVQSEFIVPTNDSVFPWRPLDIDIAPYITLLPLKYEWPFFTYQGVAPTFTFICMAILEADDIALFGSPKVLLRITWLDVWI